MAQKPRVLEREEDMNTNYEELAERARTVNQRIKDFQSERMKHFILIYSDPTFREKRLTFQHGGILS